MASSLVAQHHLITPGGRRAPDNVAALLGPASPSAALAGASASPPPPRSRKVHGAGRAPGARGGERTMAPAIDNRTNMAMKLRAEHARSAHGPHSPGRGTRGARAGAKHHIVLWGTRDC